MVSIKDISIVFFVFSLIVHVKSQTCESTSYYSSCSTNSACGCLPLAFADNIGICGLTSVSCSRLNSCQSDDTCQNADHICVHHPRCSSTPLCYPLSMVDQRLCPPMATTTTSTTIPFFTTETTTSRSFFTTETTTSATDTEDYDSNYYTSDPFPPTDLIMSNYSNQLTTNNAKIPNSNKYYQAIEVLVNTSGYYDIRSLSNIDTYGCLYRGNYNPSSTSNQITCNDDYINNQFRLSPFLEAGVSYTLLFTTYSSDVTGSYSVVASGPGEVGFHSIDAVQTATTEFYGTFTTATETSNFSIFSYYSSELTENSEIYPETNKYYEAIQIMVNTSGFYTLSSIENLDGYGYLYQSYYNPSNPTYNLLAQDDQSGGNNQFRMQAYLDAGLPYTLVFTTYQQNIRGSFTIVVSGPSEVEFNLLNNLQTTMTIEYSNEPTSNYSNGTMSYYSGELTVNSGMFSRNGNSESNFYYEAIQINVLTTGFYRISSQSNTSESYMDVTDAYAFTSEGYNMTQVDMDTYGYIYQNSFNPSNPSMNLIAQDDDSAGNRQFAATVFLQSGVTYVVVFTTYYPGMTGPFSIVTSGPNNVIFN